MLSVIFPLKPPDCSRNVALTSPFGGKLIFSSCLKTGALDLPHFPTCDAYFFYIRLSIHTVQCLIGFWGSVASCFLAAGWLVGGRQTHSPLSEPAALRCAAVASGHLKCTLVTSSRGDLVGRCVVSPRRVASLVIFFLCLYCEGSEVLEHTDIIEYFMSC